MRNETDEGREKRSREHTSRHTSPEMANSRTLAKHRVHHPSKAPCLHPAKVFRLSKNKKERALSFSGKLPAPSILVNFFEIGSGRPLPLYYCLILRLFMDVCCPSLPLKIMVVDEFRATEHTTIYVAACRCHRIDCSLCALFINIESLSFITRNPSSRELSCIKYQYSDCQELF